MVAAAKFLVEATKNSFVVPNFVGCRNKTKPFFFSCSMNMVETQEGNSCIVREFKQLFTLKKIIKYTFEELTKLKFFHLYLKKLFEILNTVLGRAFYNFPSNGLPF